MTSLARPTRLLFATAISTAAAALTWQVVHRTSPAVRGWSAPTREVLDGGPLFATTTTTATTTATTPPVADPVVILLHGITSSGLSFGAQYDTLPATVLVPDLLGFGRSMTVPTDAYDVDDHVRAVRDTIETAGLSGRPTLVVGHSMGAVLALHLAVALPDPIGVVSLSAPLYQDEEEALDHIGAADPLAGLLATGDLAQRVCEWMCDHRRLASTLWPLLAPQWPRPVAADGVLHTWVGYRGSLGSLVLSSGYGQAMQALDEAGVPIILVNGAEDGVPVARRAEALASTHPLVEHVSVPGASHALPLSHADRCVALIRDRLQRWSDR